MKKKDRERYQLERFNVVFPSFPPAAIIDGKDDGSEPDFFVIIDKNRRVGVELTELYRAPEAHKPPLQADESIRRQIIKRACSIHEDWGGPPLDVCVFFSMNEEWTKKRVPVLAAKVAQIVSNNLPPEGESRLLENPWLNRTHFPYEIEMIDIRNYRGIKKPHWHCPEGGAVPELPINQLQETIDRKNERLPRYRQTVPEVWLVIIYDLGMSSWFDSTTATLNHRYKSQFDRTFLFNWFRQSVVLMVTDDPSSFSL